MALASVMLPLFPLSKTLMTFRRPCLDCGALGEPGQSRCPEHARGKERQRKAVRGKTPVANRLSRTLRNLPAERCRACELVFPPRFLNVDHVVAIADGGSDSLDNLQILCKDCHRAKTSNEAKARKTDEHDGY